MGLRSVVSGAVHADTLGLVGRVIGGGEPIIEVVQELTDSGRYVALERVWTDDLDALVADYEQALIGIGASGLGPVAEVVLPGALLEIPRGAEALDELCAQARDCAVPVTLAATEPATIDAALAVVARQRALGRDAGIVLPAALRRTERDCATVTGRVRIVKGGAAAMTQQAYTQAIEVDKSFIRCAKALFRRGMDVTPSFATQDGRIIEIIQTLAGRFDRSSLDYEIAMYLGRSAPMQQRLVDAGEQVRVYLPFGPDRLGRLVGGLDERRGGVGSALRALLPGA